MGPTTAHRGGNRTRTCCRIGPGGYDCCAARGGGSRVAPGFQLGILKPYMLPHRPGRLRLPHGPWRCRERVDSAIGPPRGAIRRGFPRQHVACPVWSLLAQRIIAVSALGTISEQYSYRTILVEYRAAFRRITSVGRALAGGIPSQGTGCAQGSTQGTGAAGPRRHWCRLPAGYFGSYGAPLRGWVGRAAVYGRMRQEGGVAGRRGRRRATTSSGQRWKKRCEKSHFSSGLLNGTYYRNL